MDDGSAVILSVAKYYSPGGKAIQDTGVTPSVPVAEVEAVALDDDGNPTTVETPQQPGEDVLLKKAIEVVTKGKGNVASTSTPETKKTMDVNPNHFITPDPTSNEQHPHIRIQGQEL